MFDPTQYYMPLTPPRTAVPAYSGNAGAGVINPQSAMQSTAAQQGHGGFFGGGASGSLNLTPGATDSMGFRTNNISSGLGRGGYRFNGDAGSMGWSGQPAAGGAGGTGNVGTSIQQAMDTANNANNTRYNQLLQMSGQLSDSAMQNEQKALSNNLGRVDQNAIAAGIGNSTVLPSMERGVQDDSLIRQSQINDQGLRSAMGIVERRTDQAPNYNLLAALASRPGAVGGAAGGGAIGGGGGRPGGRQFNPLTTYAGPDSAQASAQAGAGQQQAATSGWNPANNTSSPPYVPGGPALSTSPPPPQYGQPGYVDPQQIAGYDSLGNPLDANGNPIDTFSANDPTAGYY